MKKFILGLFAGLFISGFIFIAALGTANKLSMHNQHRIEVLESEVKALNVIVCKQDSLVVNVNVEPQTIKIYEKCTD